ncbi:YciI family protein [Staphylospora marina]|uniref:YciI family protein n=1 Tax=Staphylospora marina TaxID=2490858 RepID=UPI000F5B8E2A|nr:YciI family protein [Staphylospora marina]
MFVAILRYKLPFEEVQKHVKAHRDYLDGQYREKRLIVSGPMTSKTGGVMVFRVQTREEVDRIIEGDPYYLNGVAEYEVIEFDPVKHDPVFREHFL